MRIYIQNCARNYTLFFSGTAILRRIRFEFNTKTRNGRKTSAHRYLSYYMKSIKIYAEKRAAVNVLTERSSATTRKIYKTSVFRSFRHGKAVVKRGKTAYNVASEFSLNR